MALEWVLWATLFTISYLIVVECVRFRRAKSSGGLAKKYADRSSWSKMTVEEAFNIQVALGQIEFPQTFSASIFFALFKTYGLPSISTHLVKTGQLSSNATVSKRAADTGVLLAEIVLNEPSSQRAMQAIARMNHLHAPYQHNGAITNDDMLYTLSLFLLEPSRWVVKYEWRHLSKLERCAQGTYWKSLGDAMGISYNKLPSSNRGWRDGLHWLHEMEEWSLQYEEQHMLPAPSNKALADGTIALLLRLVPGALQPLTKNMILELMGHRLRQAMMESASHDFNGLTHPHD